MRSRIMVCVIGSTSRIFAIRSTTIHASSVNHSKAIFTLTGVVAPAVADDESGASQPAAAGVVRSAERLRPTAIEKPPSEKHNTLISLFLSSNASTFCTKEMAIRRAQPPHLFQFKISPVCVCVSGNEKRKEGRTGKTSAAECEAEWATIWWFSHADRFHY